MRSQIRLLYILLAFSCVHSEIDYCTILRCPNESHTLCRFKRIGASRNCGRTIPYELGHLEINTIIFMHINPRQPPELVGSSNVHGQQTLEWDEDLAKSAQRWADQCQNKPDECRNEKDFDVAQQVGIDEPREPGSEPSLAAIIRKWYLEQVSIIRRFGEDPEDYQNFIFGYTKIGCGGVKSILNLRIKLRLVCNYGPA